jgi:two-component system, chemotaxis family, sensor kinase Cph1
LFVRDALSREYAEAERFKQVASGLLALSITKIRKNYLLWFRPEILQYVNWAGDPNKQQHIEPDGSITLSPRHSFDLWQETVQGKSLPWQACEIEGALELRSAIVGIVLRKADEIATINLELERSNAELDAFAYIASHDLKEPLRGIHNYAAFLLKDYADTLDEEGVSKLETLVRLTKRMEDLINSLLHFSRLGRQELNLQPLDLNELVQNVSEVLHMSQRGTPIQIRIPQPLPTIRADRILIEEVLTNLISNGLKYNNQAEKWVEVGFITPDSPSATPLLYIRDNGIGIREEHRDIIFRIFKRLHAPGKYGGGTGAGLTIVKKIIERHGGYIWVESVYGEGSTFYFSLPD